ncbi:MAG: extracellular solute-binding protein [Desulfobulbaceae bacterium]|nr:extracellular solute-binding protein [Desulfobulbaceae bacterium]
MKHWCDQLLISVALSAILAGCLAGCEREQSPPEQQSIPEISLYHYFSGELSGGLDDMVATVNERHHNRRLVAHPLDHEAFKTMIHSTLDKGSPPELFTYWAGARTQALVDQGQLEPIDDLWRQAGLDRRFPKSIADAACTYNGNKYLLPITQHLVVFFYNKRLAERADLTPPTTWTELLAWCGVMQSRGITAFALGARERWPAQFWFDYLLLRTAGPRYRAALMAGEALYTDPEVVNTYRIWSELVEQGYFNADSVSIDWAEAAERVCRGEAAATLMGTWAIQTFTGSPCHLEPEVDFDFFVFPVIDTTLPDSSVGPIDGIVLTRESLNHEFAKEVITYFSENEPQQQMSRGSGALAPSSDVPQDFYTPFKQRLFTAIQQSEEWVFNYDLASSPLVAEKGMDSFIELLAYPDQYRAILRELASETAKLSEQ